MKKLQFENTDELKDTTHAHKREAGVRDSVYTSKH